MYVVVDLHSGQLWTTDDDDPTKVVSATEADRKLVQQFANRRKGS